MTIQNKKWVIFSYHLCILVLIQNSIFYTKANCQTIQIVPDKKIVYRKSEANNFDIYISKLNDDNLQSVFFLDDNTGWVGGQKGIYKTSDSGKSWKKLDFLITEEYYISKIRFVDISNGWIIVQRTSNFTRKYKSDGFFIYNTKDGGDKWELQTEIKGCIANDIFFEDEKKGVIVGVCTNTRSFADDNYLILKTENKGQNWRELSNILTIKATSIIGFIKNKSSILVSSNKQIYTSYDEGEIWQHTINIKDTNIFGYQTNLKKIGFLQNKLLWIMSGFSSIREGNESFFYIEKENQTFTKYMIKSDVFLTDALNISENNLIASGSVLKNYENKGLILYYKVGDDKWQTILEDESINQFNALSSTKSLVWGVGEKGTFVKFKIKKDL